MWRTFIVPLFRLRDSFVYQNSNAKSEQKKCFKAGLKARKRRGKTKMAPPCARVFRDSDGDLLVAPSMVLILCTLFQNSSANYEPHSGQTHGRQTVGFPWWITQVTSFDMFLFSSLQFAFYDSVRQLSSRFLACLSHLYIHVFFLHFHACMNDMKARQHSL